MNASQCKQYTNAELVFVVVLPALDLGTEHNCEDVLQ